MADDLDEFEELPEREPAWMLLGRSTACRKRLLAAGYQPIPVNGKAPPLAGWQDIEATNVLIDTWANEFNDATNTGILTRNIPAIDIDVLDPAVADELQQIAERMIGTSAVRIGQAPKRAMLFRADVPFDKISTPIYVSPDGRAHKVEVHRNQGGGGRRQSVKAQRRCMRDDLNTLLTYALGAISGASAASFGERGRRDRRLVYGLGQSARGRPVPTDRGRRRWLFLPCRIAHGRDHRDRRAEDPIPAFRRYDKDRKVGRGRPLDLWRHRTAERT
jgi:Bifunctional DNA primase/polymerase, N-terminal